MKRKTIIKQNALPVIFTAMISLIVFGFLSFAHFNQEIVENETINDSIRQGYADNSTCWMEEELEERNLSAPEYLENSSNMCRMPGGGRP